MDATSTRKPYPSDLTDPQWELIELLIPPPLPGGRPRDVNMCEIVNAMLYLSRSGCHWDMLAHDLPAKSTVYEYWSIREGTLLKAGIKRMREPGSPPSPILPPRKCGGRE